MTMNAPRRKGFARYPLAWFAAAILLAGCASQPLVIPENLTAGEIFQHAQDAVEKGNYDLGISYYSLFKEKHPEDSQRGAWASYEIAFLYHKMGKDEKALSLIEELLSLYSADKGALPAAPRILAVKLKTRLSEKAPPKS